MPNWWILIFPEITSFKNAMKIPKKCHRKIEKNSRLHEKTSLSGPWRPIQGVLEWILSTFKWVRISKFYKSKMETKKLSDFYFICVSCFSQKIVNYIFPYFPLKYRLCDVSIVEYLLRQNRMSMSWKPSYKIFQFSNTRIFIFQIFKMYVYNPQNISYVAWPNNSHLFDYKCNFSSYNLFGIFQNC